MTDTIALTEALQEKQTPVEEAPIEDAKSLQEQYKEFNEELSKQPTEVQAVVFLKGALPKFERLLMGVTGPETKQVLQALTKSPLEDIPFEFETNKQKQLFTLGTMITNAKFVLFSMAQYNTIHKILKEVYNVDVPVQELRNLVNEELGEPLESPPTAELENADVTSESQGEENGSKEI